MQITLCQHRTFPRMLFEDRAGLLGPEQKIQLGRGDAYLFGKLEEFMFEVEILFFGKVVRNFLDDAVLVEIFEDVAVNNGEVGAETDIAQEVAGFFPA